MGYCEKDPLSLFSLHGLPVAGSSSTLIVVLGVGEFLVYPTVDYCIVCLYVCCNRKLLFNDSSITRQASRSTNNNNNSRFYAGRYHAADTKGVKIP
jgi:hypothetical protein